jgi:hypothetical protein
MRPPSLTAGHAALAVASLALVLSTTGIADAARQRTAKIMAPKSTVKVVTKPQRGALLLLDRQGRFPARAIPKVNAARNADRVGGQRAADLQLNCIAEAVDMGTWCLMANTYPLPPEDTGKNDFFYATKACTDMGGYLPTAAQLIGAAEKVKLASTIDDDRLTASIDLDPTDGLKDRREMSATLATTAAGSSAAGALGVSEGSKGDPKAGEPDPAPLPASPAPETLQYITVYDNRNRGGFSGSKPVGQPENFRCAFDKVQGEQNAEEG